MRACIQCKICWFFTFKLNLIWGCTFLDSQNTAISLHPIIHYTLYSMYIVQYTVVAVNFHNSRIGIFTVLSAGFSIFVYQKCAVHGVHNLRPCTGFFSLSIAVNITVYIPYLFLPFHVLYISSGHFCALEYCSVFAGIYMSSAFTVCVLFVAHFR